MKPQDLKHSQQLLKIWKENPVVRHYQFSDKKLWSKQEEALWAYRKHKRLAIKSSNTVGKSFIIADIAMDFLTVNYPAKVITTAPTWPQVEDILWKEIASYYHNSKIPIGGTLLKTELAFNEEWFAVGVSTDEPVRFQGRHSPNLLVLVDEASGLKPEIWDIIDALHPSKIVAVGNPLENSGRFFDCFSSSLWHTMTISSKDAIEWQKVHGVIPGLVTQEWVNDMREIHGERSAYYQIHVNGEFPEEGENSLISRAWLERARKGLDADNRKLEKEQEQDVVRVIASDVATKHGNNETVLGYRYGHTFKWMKGYHRATLTETADRLTWEQQKHKVVNVTVDSDGVGEGLSDILTSKRVPVIEFHGGYAQKAIDATRFRNLRSQFFWIVAKKLEKGMYDLSELGEKEYQILKNQLCAIRLKPPDGMGRIQIETKEDMLARGVESPDYADTFMMAEYSWFMAKYMEIKPLIYR